MVVVGEVLSRCTLPHVYTPMDIDFAVTSALRRRHIKVALKEIGFHL